MDSIEERFYNLYKRHYSSRNYFFNEPEFHTLPEVTQKWWREFIDLIAQEVPKQTKQETQTHHKNNEKPVHILVKPSSAV